MGISQFTPCYSDLIEAMRNHAGSNAFVKILYCNRGNQRRSSIVERPGHVELPTVGDAQPQIYAAYLRQRMSRLRPFTFAIRLMKLGVSKRPLQDRPKCPVARLWRCNI